MPPDRPKLTTAQREALATALHREEQWACLHAVEQAITDTPPGHIPKRALESADAKLREALENVAGLASRVPVAEPWFHEIGFMGPEHLDQIKLVEAAGCEFVYGSAARDPEGKQLGLPVELEEALDLLKGARRLFLPERPEDGGDPDWVREIKDGIEALLARYQASPAGEES